MILSASDSSSPFFKVYFPHIELPITGYFNVVASVSSTMLKVSNLDETIILYVDAYAVSISICIDFSVVLCSVLECLGLDR